MTNIGWQCPNPPLKCPANSAAPDGSESLSSCECNDGFTGANGGTCSKCIAGTYKDTSGPDNCKRCPINTDSPEGSTASTDCVCIQGSTSSNGGACFADGEEDQEESLAKEAGKELILGIVGAIGGAIGMALIGYMYKKFGVQNPEAQASNPSDHNQSVETPVQGQNTVMTLQNSTGVNV